ncbi:hypothetical protein B0H16DRAFT_102522 [Mycena metata]|uniref:Novel STAND NTPase 1 domain-containing protein n=1 Tax=Mycena metata TaxID=1033252 RepID=A0AAD7IA66_9AGAR|nr:hypothetical protein B0H16DRAFT_102522 [Mycena metata]
MTTQALLAGVQVYIKYIRMIIQHLSRTQNVKTNKDQCFQLIEGTYQVIYAIIRLHLESGTVGFVSSAILEDISKFTGTLHKIYTFVGIQQEGNRIKQFFRKSEVNGLLKDCRAGLEQAKEVFKVQIGVTVLDQVQSEAESMHKELLDIISSLSDGTVSDSSFSMLPSKPKIFHGRDSELRDIMEGLSQDVPRIAILGGGGMGKTSLARAALHHPDTCAKFQHRFFVSAEPATTVIELAALVGLHLGLEPGQDLTKPVVQHFTQQPSPCLLVLDNLETPWEPIQSRGRVEDFLSLLTDVNHLALMITMRGSERPGQVRWTRPFLQPLQPLSDEASQQIFEDITDDSHASEEKTQLLKFTENMPLAVNLMAHLVDYEGLTNVLTRWKTEKTATLSTGHHRTSNLDTSIALSYSSPRITPGARELLRLLSILPDGLSDVELTQGNLPISDIRSCTSVLIATSLAYKDTQSRLRSLVPIREHIQQVSPPSETLVQAIRKSFHDLLALYQNHNDAHLGIILTRITANLANLDEVLHRGLKPGSSDLSETIQGVLSLSSFFRVTRGGGTTLLDEIPIHLCDHRINVLYITERLKFPRLVDIGQLVTQGLSHLHQLHDPMLEARFYAAAGRTYFKFQSSAQQLEFLENALELSKSIGDSEGQCDSLIAMAEHKWRIGDYITALSISRNAQQLAYQTINLYQVSRAMHKTALSLADLGDYWLSLS